mmetsp:Transcript_95347/g.308925  ORF Transcript_95347/g.308925 Transcript_95347/m.308925 type:complete len:289 (+) Transcript_95347:2266-3132(+)
MHHENLAVDHGCQRQPGEDPRELFVDQNTRAITPAILRQDLFIKATTVRIHVEKPVLVVAALYAHRLRPHAHECKEERPNLRGQVATVADVAVEEVSVGRRGHPKLVKYPQDVSKLPMRVSDDIELHLALVKLPRIGAIGSPKRVRLHRALALLPSVQVLLGLLQQSAEVARGQRCPRALLEVPHQLHCPIQCNGCFQRLQPRPHVAGARPRKISRSQGGRPSLRRGGPEPATAARGGRPCREVNRSRCVRRWPAEQIQQLALHLRAQMGLTNQCRLIHVFQLAQGRP